MELAAKEEASKLVRLIIHWMPGRWVFVIYEAECGLPEGSMRSLMACKFNRDLMICLDN